MQFPTWQPAWRLLFGPGPTMAEPYVYEALSSVLEPAGAMLRPVKAA